MTKEELLQRWQKTIRQLQLEHELASRYYEKLNLKLGIPTVALTAIVGASIFGTIQKSALPEKAALWVGVTAGFLSLASLVLSSLQTFLGFGNRASGHKAAADRLGELAKEAQEVLVFGLPDAEFKNFITDFRTRWDAAAREAPMLRKSTIIALRYDLESLEPGELGRLRAVGGNFVSARLRGTKAELHEPAT